MNTSLVILFLALLGFGDSLYLNHERKNNRPPRCLIVDGCEKVWKSKYSTTFGVSNEILGIIFYATMVVIEWTIFVGDKSSLMVFGETLFLMVGFVASLYFIFLEWRVIRAWCFWCTMSALIVWAMTVLAFFA